MKKTTWITILILVLLCAVILIFPLMTIRDSEFGGADGAAEEAIAQIDPEYEPWAESLIELPGGETESLLFCLQTALGALVIGFGFGYLVARKKYRAEEAA
ncbi:MAG: energy-coupling factor ABC transporter substrate-binding protein [Clostridiales bacterium]|nr:energy-coupling factor ABC transporter substrate-binding protein [Clostridiales bacterium]